MMSVGARSVGVPTTVARAVRFAQKMLQSTDVPFHTAPSAIVPVTTGGGTAELVVELDEAKSRVCRDC